MAGATVELFQDNRLESSYGQAALAASPILDLANDALMARGLAQRLTRASGINNAAGIWIHIDSDVLNLGQN
jgi:hypothetical protein